MGVGQAPFLTRLTYTIQSCLALARQPIRPKQFSLLKLVYRQYRRGKARCFILGCTMTVIASQGEPKMGAN